MNSLTLKAPAKINLFLEVLRKQEDGFHQIQTIFQAINLYDIVHIKKSRKKGISVKTNYKQLPTGRKNLCFRAAETLRQRYKKIGGVEIIIDKNIPLAAGLGGGSSDTATTLIGINRLWKLKLKKEELCEIGKGLGSDVPFFMSGYKSALGEGRGEILRSLKLPRYWFLLVLPGFGSSSKEAYSRLQLHLTKKPKSAKMLLRALEKKDISQIAKKLYNRLEEKTLIEFPMIKKMKQALRTAGCKAVLMSGSGPSVFALTVTRKEAIATEERLKLLGWYAEVVRSL